METKTAKNEEDSEEEGEGEFDMQNFVQSLFSHNELLIGNRVEQNLVD